MSETQSIEEWRVVEEFPTYEVSSWGRIRRGAKFRKPMLNPVSGYMEVLFCVHYKKTMRRWHRVVAVAFIGIPAGKEVNHKDGNRTNNHLDNLEVVTRSENNLHKFRVLGNTWDHHGIKNPAAKLSESEVMEIRSLRGTEDSISVANRFSIGRSAVYDVWRKRTWSHLPDLPLTPVK